MATSYMKAVVVGLLLYLCADCFAGSNTLITIAKTGETDAYVKAISGFKKKIAEHNAAIEFSEYTLGGDDNALLEKIKQEKPSLILTVGTPVSKLVAGAIKDTPVVYCVVLDHSLINTARNSNVCGGSMQMPMELKYTYACRILPGANRFGVIYTERTEAFFESLESLAKKTGVKIVGRKIASSKELNDVCQDICWRIDVLFMVPDPVIYTIPSIKHIILKCLENKIALVGISSPYTEAGALFSMDCDYEDIGKQAGEMAMQVINGEAPGDIPVSIPRKHKLSINLNTADKIGVNIPAAILKEDVEVYK